MARQLLFNRGFESGLMNFHTQGNVSSFSDIAYSGTKSVLLLSDPTSSAELSQVIMFLIAGTPIRFSFVARKFRNEDIKSVSNVRAEVHFLSAFGTVIPPGMVISIRGRDLAKKWHYYEEYGDVPIGAVAAQIVVRLEPPASGTSGLLIDDLALVAEIAPSPPHPAAIPMSPGKQGIPGFMGPHLKDSLTNSPGGKGKEKD